jgi:hypothetical protein
VPNGGIRVRVRVSVDGGDRETNVPPVHAKVLGKIIFAKLLNSIHRPAQKTPTIPPTEYTFSVDLGNNKKRRAIVDIAIRLHVHQRALDLLRSGGGTQDADQARASAFLATIGDTKCTAPGFSPRVIFSPSRA